MATDCAKATPKQKETLEAFVKANKGRTGIVSNKDNKKILVDAKIAGPGGYMDTNSADIAYAKIMGKVGGKARGGLSYDEYCDKLAAEIGTTIAKKCKCSDEEGKKKCLEAIESASPQLKGTTKAQTGGATGRLTDTSKYTGAHKERFDAEGKGKGKGGREEIVENTGYVQAYKNKDSYDDTHK